MSLRIARIAWLVSLVICTSVASADERKPAAADGEKPADAAEGVEASAAHLEHALRSPTEVQYLETQLVDVVNELELRHKIAIQLDATALAAQGTSGDTPISKQMRDVTLGQALDRLLRPHSLTWHVRDNVLVITTFQAALSASETRVYSVAGLADIGEPDYDAIEKVVDSSVFRPVHSHVDRAIRPHHSTRTLVVAANPVAQRWIAQVIRELHEAKQYQGDAVVLPLESETAARISRALAKPTEVQYLDTPLGDVRTDLELRHRVFIELDEDAIKDAGKEAARGAEMPVTFTAKNVALGTILDQMLDPAGLTWTRDDVSIVITSKHCEADYLVRRIYRVGDLAATADEYDELVELVRDTVASDTWGGAGQGGAAAAYGPVPSDPLMPRPRRRPIGEIVRFMPAKAIVVTQTPRTQRAIEKLLDDLRAAKQEL